jgi:hypothetical protein
MKICNTKVGKKLDNDFKAGHLYVRVNKLSGKPCNHLLMCNKAGVLGLILNYVHSGDLFMSCGECTNSYIDVTDKYCLQEK